MCDNNNLKEYYSFVSKEIMEHQRARETQWINIKIMFIGFLGTIIAILYNKEGDQNIIIFVLSIIVISFFLLIRDFWVDTKDSENATKNFNATLKKYNENFEEPEIKKSGRFFVVFWGILFLSAPVILLIKLLLPKIIEILCH